MVVFVGRITNFVVSRPQDTSIHHLIYQAQSTDLASVIYHPLYSMNNFVTKKSKLPQDGHKCFFIWGDWLSCDPLIGSHDSQSPNIGTYLFIPYKG